MVQGGGDEQKTFWDSVLMLLFPAALAFLFLKMHWTPYFQMFFRKYEYVIYVTVLQLICVLGLCIMLVYRTVQFTKLGMKRSKLLKENNLEVKVGERRRIKSV